MSLNSRLVFKLALFLLLFLFSIFLVIKVISRPSLAMARATLSEGQLVLELAQTDKEIIKGLSGRKELPADQGLLFIFGDYVPRSFWMKNMNFPIDIIWLNDRVVTGIVASAQPEGENPRIHYISPGPANSVLEVNAGWATEYNVKVGDVLIIN